MEKACKGCGRLCPCSLGLALGILWSVALMFMGFMAMYTSYGHVFVHFVGSFYVGYSATLAGTLIGGVWGFVDACIFGVLAALFYNLFACHCCKCVKD